jgi:hypothetical protein
MAVRASLSENRSVPIHPTERGRLIQKGITEMIGKMPPALASNGDRLGKPDACNLCLF